MYRILRKQVFSPSTFLWDVDAPDVARAAQPGQFVMVRLHDGGERIPLTVADYDRERGIVTLVVKVVGKTTEEMTTYPEGGSFFDFIGPLGAPSHIEKKDHVIVIGGGLGVAPIFPIVRRFHKLGTHVTTVIGFRSQSEIFWKERFENLSSRLILMTDDGSAGAKGTVIDGLKMALSEGGVDEVMAIGPIPMMKAVADVTRPLTIPTMASINSIMVDGIGMCGSCRVTVDGKVLFACVDGPDFDAHKVDFDELKIRQMRFASEEKNVLQKYRESLAASQVECKSVPFQKDQPR